MYLRNSASTALITLVVLLVTACGSATTHAPAPTATGASVSQVTAAPEATALPQTSVTDTAGKTYEIAVVVKITGIPWFNRFEEGVTQAATDLEVNAYQVGPAQADPAQQVKVIEDLIARGVDAIAVVPDDAKSLEPVLAKAREKGIIVVTHESPDQVGSDYDLELIDNSTFAHHAWDTLVQYAGDSGEYALIVGSLTVPLHNFWADEGITYAKEKYPNLKLVTERIPSGEDQELSRQKTLELIQTYPNLKGIIGFGSLGPPGAAQALREKGLIDKIAVVGNVIPSQAIPFLDDGALKQGLLWDPKDGGYGLVWLAKQLLDKKPIASGDQIPNIGAVTVEGKVIKANAIIDITKENAASFGF